MGSPELVTVTIALVFVLADLRPGGIGLLTRASNTKEAAVIRSLRSVHKDSINSLNDLAYLGIESCTKLKELSSYFEKMCGASAGRSPSNDNGNERIRCTLQLMAELDETSDTEFAMLKCESKSAMGVVVRTELEEPSSVSVKEPVESATFPLTHGNDDDGYDDDYFTECSDDECEEKKKRCCPGYRCVLIEYVTKLRRRRWKGKCVPNDACSFKECDKSLKCCKGYVCVFDKVMTKGKSFGECRRKYVENPAPGNGGSYPSGGGNYPAEGGGSSGGGGSYPGSGGNYPGAGGGGSGLFPIFDFIPKRTSTSTTSATPKTEPPSPAAAATTTKRPKPQKPKPKPTGKPTKKPLRPSAATATPEIPIMNNPGDDSDAGSQSTTAGANEDYGGGPMYPGGITEADLEEYDFEA